MKQLALIIAIGTLSGCASPHYQSAIQIPKNDCRNRLIHNERIERELDYTRPIPFLKKEHDERIFELKNTYWALQYNCNPV